MPSLHHARTLAALASAALLSSLFGAPSADSAGDELQSQQWGLGQIKVTSAWPSASGAGVRIGVVDSGIDLGHPDLAGKIVAAAACVDTNGTHAQCQEGAAAADIDGHGTHVAGIAAAVTGNTTGVAGVAPGAELVVARVFKKDGNGNVTARLQDLQAGIRYVVAHGAKVVNLSVGVDQTHLPILGTGNSENPMFDTVQAAWDTGALPVVASGNSNQELFGGSANYGVLDAIVVAATGKDDRLASYSSPVGNAKWAIAAPGGNPSSSSDNANMILSTYKDNKYAYIAGTSQAAPHVSGVAALLFAQGLNRQQVVDTILGTADKSVNCGSNCKGRLDAAKAVSAHASSGGPAPTAAPATPAPTTRAPRTTTRVTAAPVTAEPAVTLPEVVASPETLAPETTIAPALGDPVIFAAKPPLRTGGDGAPAPLKAAGVIALVGTVGGLVLLRRDWLTAGATR